MKRKIYWKNIKHGLVTALFMTGIVALLTGDFKDIPAVLAIATGVTISNIQHDLKKIKK